MKLRRTPAQARKDKALLEKVFRRKAKLFSPHFPPPSVLPAFRGAWAARMRLITRLGWTLTKASYLRAMFGPSMPEFPLDQSEKNEIPKELPGRVPRSVREMFDLSEPQTSDPRRRRRARVQSAGRNKPSRGE